MEVRLLSCQPTSMRPNAGVPHLGPLKYTCLKCKVWFSDRPDWCPRCFGEVVSKFHSRINKNPEDIRFHGTASAYRKHGCRCEDCKAAVSKQRYDWIAKKGMTWGEYMKQRRQAYAEPEETD